MRRDFKGEKKKKVGAEEGTKKKHPLISKNYRSNGKKGLNGTGKKKQRARPEFEIKRGGEKKRVKKNRKRTFSKAVKKGGSTKLRFVRGGKNGTRRNQAGKGAGGNKKKKNLDGEEKGKKLPNFYRVSG